MRVTLLAATQMNPDLLTQDLETSDVRYLVAQGPQAFASALIEYAGRVCYRSTDKMGTAPNFISARVREGHEDIIEHLQMVFEAWEAPDEQILQAYQVSHGLRFTRRPASVLLSMNARTLRDIIKQSDCELARHLLRLAAATWPLLYADLAGEKA